MNRLKTLLSTLSASLLLLAAPAFAGDGPSGIPLPKDAKSTGAAPGGAGKIVTYDVQRGRDAVAKELEELLRKDGWKVDSNEKSPRGSVRMTVSKDKTVVKLSLAGDATRCAIILTLP